ncbi:MAG TPA: 30S ribosomal protein S20 [Candidatus Thiothrix moscowensis]|uniref:30S ribosomal protein S20 n=1 Tax=unclassified Thiothrix TaxID=2636184 RepID=UPI001A30FCE3|nr:MULTISPECIES: 30S ribosomal protein S20 [unclassified Thiothrix]MBJ6610416.1 30S ribosomal protein S20 [Candidatus Thiothrix moscowensis]HRJ51170.1 30S ribosomal protein S20 [Candidatus Thiothrix moscowensis]HRJ91775.1 30S ribosomal protein S20 [Candidatus Thiothrix moscowensis]
MPNIASAKKRVRQSEERRMHNRHMRSRLRTQIKNVLKAIAAGDREAAVAAYNAAVPVIDSIADKGIVHKNKAARHKSRLNAHIKALQAA